MIEADQITQVLLDARLAACVQTIGPITSRYVWNDSIETATEYLVLVKTTAGQADAAVAAIVEAHSYDVPEVLVTPVIGGHAPYLEWVAGNT